MGVTHTLGVLILATPLHTASVYTTRTKDWRTWDSGGGGDLIIATLPSLETVSYCIHEIHHIKLIEMMWIVFLTFSILHNRLISKLLSRSRSPNSAILASMSLCHVDSSNCNHICIFQRWNAILTCKCWSWAWSAAKLSPAVFWPLVNKRKRQVQKRS